MTKVDRIEWIEAFVAVADLGSFSRAAEYLHRSQSRISIYVANLEHSLGHQLIDRSRQPARPTDAGLTFLDHARRILFEISKGVDELDEAAGTIRGQFVLGALPSISALFVPEALRRMKLFHPEVNIYIMERTTGELLDHLLDDTINLALRCTSEPIFRDTKASIPLWGEPIIAVFPQGHPNANGREDIGPEELSMFEIGTTGSPGIGIDPDMSTRLDSWGIASPRSRYHTEQPQTLVNMAKAGLVVPVINLLAYLSCDHSGLTYRVVAGDRSARIVGLYWNPSRPKTAAMQAFIDTVLAMPIPEGTIKVSSGGSR